MSDLRAARDHAALLRDLNALCVKYAACTATPPLTMPDKPGALWVLPDDQYHALKDMLDVGGITDDAATSGPTYIAGPMTGYADHNYPAFNNMAKRLRAAGLTVINPAEIHPDTTHPWDWYLRRDIAELVKCPRVVFLPGWFGSRGARLEHKVAHGLGLDLVYPPDVDAFIAAARRGRCWGCADADGVACCRGHSGRDHA